MLLAAFLSHVQPVRAATWQRRSSIKIFGALHNIPLLGIRASICLLAARFAWKGLLSDAASWCRECVHCARGQITRQPRTPVQQIPIPKQLFSHIHIDIIGPLPVSREGHSFLLTMINRTSRWIEAGPLTSISTEACAEALVSGWIARYGVPAIITFDRGSQFFSSLWTSLCGFLGIQHVTTSSYHPQSNGM